jgi:hypothetical protein
VFSEVFFSANATSLEHWGQKNHDASIKKNMEPGFGRPREPGRTLIFRAGMAHRWLKDPDNSQDYGQSAGDEHHWNHHW